MLSYSLNSTLPTPTRSFVPEPTKQTGTDSTKKIETSAQIVETLQKNSNTIKCDSCAKTVYGTKANMRSYPKRKFSL